MTTPPHTQPETAPARRGIDHVVLCVRDLDAAVARFQRLGFTTTPRGVHPWGTANVLVQLDGNFIELLTIADPERVETAAAGDFSFGAFCARFLDAREGMAMLVFEGADARAEQAEFAAAGLDTYPPFDFQRTAHLPDGGTATVGFSLAFVTHAEMPDAAFFTCQQHAPEHFWKPDYQRHDNGAATIQQVVMVADDPPRYRDFFAHLQAPSRVTEAEDVVTVATNRGTLTVMPPTTFAETWPAARVPDVGAGPRFALIDIGVPDLATPRLENVFGLALRLSPLALTN